MTGQVEPTQLLDLGDQSLPVAKPALQPVFNLASDPHDHVFAQHEAPQTNPGGIPQGVFLTDVHVVRSQKDPKKIGMTILAGFFFVAMAGYGYVWLESGEAPDVLAWIGSLWGEGEQPVAVAPKKNPKPQKVEEASKAEPVPQQVVSETVSVWDLVRNEMGGERAPMGPALTGDQEASYRERLNHQFQYQRYKAVVELAANPVKGSADMLREALGSKKLWTKMRALIGLADLGEELTPDDIKAALSGAHAELKANFFKRFEKSPCSAGCFFVARAALPYLEPVGRAAAIRVIAREASAVRDLFLVAATQDSSELVQNEAREWLDMHSVDQSVWSQVRTISAH